jgi:formate C-acetyltransferase
MAIEVLDELQLLQPQANLQLSSRTPERLLKAAARVVRRGSGYPSFFNADEVVMAQVGMGKSLADARGGGTSGCIETGCFGKEAYLLHGYLNSPKILELALNDGRDPETGKAIGLRTGASERFASFEELYAAYERQLAYVVGVKVRVSNYLDRMYALYAPAPFLSAVVADCISRGKDYYDGGARYNTDYIQCCGLGTTTDSLSAVKAHIYEKGDMTWGELLAALASDWKGREDLRLLCANKTPKFGNDDEAADGIARRVFGSWLAAIDGRPSPRGGTYRVDILSTTCHVYFGLKTGATPDGRRARSPESDGASPAQGADRKGPTAVAKSLAKIDVARTGGSLLNQRFLPQALEGEGGIGKLCSLVRTYFKMGGHHIQFNVVDTATLREAQARPEDYRSLLVRVAGYSDYFVDLDRNHQEEIISRTAQEGF